MAATRIAISRVDPNAKYFVIGLINAVYKDTAVTNPSVIENNLNLLCEGGMSVDDRTMPVKTADWLIDNFAVIFLGLIANDRFRSTCKRAVELELSLDRYNEDTVRELRDEMQEDVYPEGTGECLVIDLSVYDPAAADKLGQRIADSIDSVSHLAYDISVHNGLLSDDESIEIGFCISNFAYLLRAFSHDLVFLSCIKDVVEIVKKELKINS